MGKLHLVVNMETSPRFLVAFVLLLAIASASGQKRSDDMKCDPKPKKGVANECADKDDQICADADGDGKWFCACKPGFIRDEDNFCVESPGNYDEESDGEYVIIKKKVFFIQEKDSKDFVEAHAECKSKFGGNGRLYEPRDQAEFNKVAGMARSYNGEGNTWLGIRTQPLAAQGDKREWYYMTKGPQEKKEDNLAFEEWAKGEPNDLKGKEDCVSILKDGDIEWEDYDCNEEGLFICELNEEEGCGSPQYAMDNFCDVENNKASCHWDGGACCNNPFPHWDEHCKGKVGCKCLDPNGRPIEGTGTGGTGCEDTDSAKKCKKCKKQKCKKSSCKDKCKKTCNLC